MSGKRHFNDSMFDSYISAVFNKNTNSILVKIQIKLVNTDNLLLMAFYSICASSK